MYVRFCCEGSCIRIDTLIPDVKLKYISIVSPNPFRPGSEQVEFVYKVPIETNVSIRIYDENNRLVAEPAVSQPRVPGTAYCDRWSGKIWDGSYAANGMYYLSLELSNGAKEVYPVFVKK
jgi:flagellar hook assembly protein FlgD